MATVISSGNSPFSVPLDEDEEVQQWQSIESSTRIDTESFHSADVASFDEIGIAPNGDILFNHGSTIAASPSVMSFGSWGFVGYSGQQQQQQQQQQRMNSLSTPSPVLSHHMNSEMRQASYSPAAAFGAVSTADASNGQGMFVFDLENVVMDMPLQSSQHLPFSANPIMDGQGEPGLLTQGHFTPPTSMLIPDFTAGFDTILPESVFGSYGHPTEFATQPLPDIPAAMLQDATNVGPWVATDMANVVFDAEPSISLTPRSDPSSIDLSPRLHAAAALHSTLPDIPKKSSGVQKSRRKSKTPPRVKTPDRKMDDGMFKFCNQTVDTFGKSAYGEMEQLERSSQKGRKGALSEEVRASALNVRKQGACFCCHIRKVKCDEQRPCKNCVKLCSQMPQLACWKFPEFTTILFPRFLDQHFDKAETSQFIEENIASFTINGLEVPCVVSLSSGLLFATTLTVKAKLFTAKTSTADILQHWRSVRYQHGVELEEIESVPLGLDFTDSDTGGPLRAELKRKVMAYMEGLVDENNYAVQLNDIITNKTDVPGIVLQLAQRYAQQAPEADAAIVRRMLGILVLQHVITRHLTLTPHSLAQLQQICPIPKAPYVSSRLLSRQVKTVVNECLKDLVSMLFDDFLKRLKSKSRKEWAPCVAAFLVFCVLMEWIEAASDGFAVAENEKVMRNMKPAKFMRATALEANRQIENMPFMQFAYQFHQIYQTHSQDVSAKSFNPLQDNARSDMWDLEPAAVEFVRGLREGIDEGELDWLTFDPILLPDGRGEDHPYPRDVCEPYMGRLVAKFLLSFKDVNYLLTRS